MNTIREAKTTLTRRHTKQTKENPDTYTILSPYTDFDLLDTDHKYYDIEFRIVRLLIYNIIEQKRVREVLHFVYIPQVSATGISFLWVFPASCFCSSPAVGSL